MAVLVWKCLHDAALAIWLTCVCRPTPSMVASNCVPQHLGLVPRTWTSTGQRSFAVNGSRTWNSLPAELRMPDMALYTFKRHLKAHLFRQYQSALLLAAGLSIAHPALLWLFSEFGADYKYSDLLTYFPFHNQQCQSTDGVHWPSVPVQFYSRKASVHNQ